MPDNAISFPFDELYLWKEERGSLFQNFETTMQQSLLNETAKIDLTRKF
jgi:hypothetical protein